MFLSLLEGLLREKEEGREGDREGRKEGGKEERREGKMDRRNKEKTREKMEGRLKEEKQGGKHVREGERGLLYHQTRSLDVPVPGAC